MKTMTCRQMGGPCDTQIHGNTPDEMIKNGEVHIREEATKGDEEHKKVLVMMEDMQKNPASGKEWSDTFMKDFAALPEE